jgi:hypothetical protein
MAYRYHVVYSSRPQWEYAVRDSETKKEVFGTNTKSEAIFEAQTRNGFNPADGDEQTFAKQTEG